jgi:signal recognition particle GTPase
MTNQGGGFSLGGSVEYADRSNSQMDDVEEIMINDDMQWKVNEEIINGFQENMALIAGNSFEILQLYIMIQEDYSKVTEKIEKTEQAIDEIASKSINLEVKLTQMMNLI